MDWTETRCFIRRFLPVISSVRLQKMITKFKNWLRKEKQWKKDHVESWKGITEIQENNLTKFQNICFEQFKSSLSDNNLELTEVKIKKINRLEKKSESYIYGILPKSNRQIYIYEDGVEIDKELRNEEWDCRTPKKMISNFIAKALELELRNNK